MLPVVAFLVAQANPANAFIEESAKAILDIKEGVWGAKGLDNAGKPYKNEMIKRGETTHTRAISGNEVQFEALIGPTSALVVYKADRKYLSQTYPRPTEKKKPDPLPPLEEGEFKYDISEERGLVLRSNPDFSQANIVVSKGTETLIAKARKADGKELVMTLVRNAKTKIPTNLKVVSPKGVLEIHFLFEARKVTDKELAIAPETYEGFEKIEPPSGNL